MKKITIGAFLLSAFFSFSQKNKELVENYVVNNATKFGVSKNDVNDLKLVSVGDSKSTGTEIYYYNQQKDGVEILNSLATIAVKNGNVVYSSGAFVNNLKKINVENSKNALQIESAFAAVKADLKLKQDISKIETKKNNNFLHFQVDGIDVTSKLVYVSNPNKNLDLVWLFELYSPMDDNLYGYQINAITGKISQKENLTITCSFGNHKHEHKAHSETKSSNFSFSESAFKASPLIVENSAYRVVPFTSESPLHHGGRELLISPAIPAASPYGWHNTVDGNTATTAGSMYTSTRGNNVFAMDDRDGVNTTVGSFAQGGANLVFDFPYNGTSNLNPEDHLNASITNLFYMNNMMHDVMYGYGFDEKNGNFQRNNYGRGETTPTDATGNAGQGDYVLAEAQDGLGLANANFSTQADGAFGSRMQMYLWNTGPQTPNFRVNNTAIAGMYLAADNSFSAGHVDYPTTPNFLTGDIVLFNDGSAEPTGACAAAVNAVDLAGKIALLKRGGCNFVAKVKNAQDAGAIAVVVYDNVDGALAGMSGADAAITIPAVRITKALGDQLVALLATETVNISIQDARVEYFDGDFDNGIIAHEYGHGISTRLAGGRLNNTCLRNSEQQGEGWSDFFAYMLSMKATDSPTLGRGIGNFTNGTSINGNGIRQYKYSTDMTVNPFTFESTNTMFFLDAGKEQIDIHSVGSVWATMLWDLAWAYINKYGFDANIVNGTGGNNKVMQLVVDGLKLQPCNANFIQARDAIIAADQATTNGANKCLIWEVFARRGLGFSARSGTNAIGANSLTGQTLTDFVAGIKDQVNGFDLPADCQNLGTENVNFSQEAAVYPIPSSNEITVSIPSFRNKINLEIADVNGRIVYSQSIENFDGSTKVDISRFANGFYVLTVKGENLNYSNKIIKK